jgi:hypothetical protein
MYLGVAYKVVGVIVNEDGTTSLSTTVVSLDQAYDALSFKFKAHSLAYGTDKQALAADQVSVVSGQSAPSQSLSKNFEVATPQKLAKSQAGFNLECIVPKLTTEGALTPSGNEWGYSFELNNCSLNQLLQLDNSYPAMNIHINGDVTASGEIDYEYNIEERTNYTETSQTASIGLTFSGALSDIGRSRLKNSGMCKYKDGTGMLQVFISLLFHLWLALCQSCMKWGLVSRLRLISTARLLLKSSLRLLPKKVIKTTFTMMANLNQRT